MLRNELLALVPTAERFLGLTDDERKLVLLLAIKETTKNPMSVRVAFEGTLGGLFERGGYDMAKRAQVQKALKTAWTALEAAGLIEEDPDPYNAKNGYRVVSEKGMKVDTRVDLAAAQVRNWLSPDLVHPALSGACLHAFGSADYDTAVFEAFKAVEASVRKKGGYSASDFGAALMDKAFDPKSGPLRDAAASATRQKARQRLFAGAMGELRNPKAHGDPTISDPQEAIEEIMVASVLLRIVGP